MFMIALPAFRFREPALDMVPAFMMLAPAVITRFSPAIALVTPVGSSVEMLAFAALITLPLAKRLAVKYWELVEMM